MPKRRIFIAIQVSEELKNTAEFYMKPFFDDRNIRIPRKEGWHITVIFCGYFNEKEIEELGKIVKGIALESKSFEITPQKILFAPPNRPRMIWLDFKNSPEFAKLKLKIEDEIIKKQKEGFFKNFRQEIREPHPHLTLARFEEKHFPNIKKFLPKEGIDLTKETAPFQIKSIDIMESHLLRAGADYGIVSNIALK
jgi:2'-5' RNA ligase